MDFDIATDSDTFSTGDEQNLVTEESDSSDFKESDFEFENGFYSEELEEFYENKHNNDISKEKMLNSIKNSNKLNNQATEDSQIELSSYCNDENVYSYEELYKVDDKETTNDKFKTQNKISPTYRKFRSSTGSKSSDTNQGKKNYVRNCSNSKHLNLFITHELAVHKVVENVQNAIKNKNLINLRKLESEKDCHIDSDFNFTNRNNETFPYSNGKFSKISQNIYSEHDANFNEIVEKKDSVIIKNEPKNNELCLTEMQKNMDTSKQTSFQDERQTEFDLSSGNENKDIGKVLKKVEDTNRMSASTYSVTKAHDELRKYKCCMCSKVFKMKHHLSQHILTHTYSRAKAKRVHKCTTCSQAFKLKHHLKRHLLTHTKEKKHVCAICNNSYVDKHDLKKHLKKHLISTEKNMKEYKNKCDSKPSNSGFECPNRKTCKLCGKNFQNRRYLNYHLRVHAKLVPFSCDICGKCFPFKSALNEHCRIHSGDKPYHCDVCQKEFTTKSNLIRHSRSHSKVFNCKNKNCDVKFTDRKELQKHLNLCIVKYKCEYCDKIFKKSSNFKRHLKVHIK